MHKPKPSAALHPAPGANKQLPINLDALVDYLNRQVLQSHHVRLRGGAAEPFYHAPRTTRNTNGTVQQHPACIEFRQDYIRSALHELAHWCIAGPHRRQLDDYGYWYQPDGRNAEQQRAFFQVEIKPQALEQLFCQALGIPFAISIDNLGGAPPEPGDVARFSQAINEQMALWQKKGLPRRAHAIWQSLLQFARLQHET